MIFFRITSRQHEHFQLKGVFLNVHHTHWQLHYSCNTSWNINCIVHGINQCVNMILSINPLNNSPGLHVLNVGGGINVSGNNMSGLMGQNKGLLGNAFIQ